MPVKNSPDETPAQTPAAQDVTAREVPTEAVKQDLPKSNEAEVKEPQSYVWLANGQVLLVNDADLPGASGVNDPYGHWQTGNKVFQIVGVYPTEVTVGE